MREEARQAFVGSVVRGHLERLVKEQGWTDLVERGEEAAARERLGLVWYEIKADLMLKKVGTRRAEILTLFEEVLRAENRERYHDLVAYDPDLPQPGEEAVDEAWASRIREAVHEGVSPLTGRVEELAAAPWRFLAELDQAFRSILRILQERSIRGSSRVVLGALSQELPGVPAPFLWGALAHEEEWTKISMPAPAPVVAEPPPPPGRAMAEAEILQQEQPSEGDPGPPLGLTAEAFRAAWGHLLWHLRLPPDAFPGALQKTLQRWEAECKDDPMVVGLWAHMLHRLADRHLHELDKKGAPLDALLLARHLRAALGILLARNLGGRGEA